MRPFDELEFNPIQESVVKILSDRTQNSDPMFFRVMFSYFLSKIASMMRVRIDTQIYDTPIPVNFYGINLSPSGSGKGRSVNIIEDQVIHKFKNTFMESTFPKIAENTLYNLAVNRANRKQLDPETELDNLRAEFEQAGPLLFSFDSGTAAAVKQMRHKLLLAGSGSMNMEIDEIGSNLMGNNEVLNAFLELFDIGKIKQKLTKHTRENVRAEELYGRTPTNMLLFGTPTKLLDGSKVESQFYDMLETGFARRCFFGFSKHQKHLDKVSAEEIYDLMQDPAANNQLALLADKLAARGDASNFAANLVMPKNVSIELIKYRQNCDRRADNYSEYEEMRQAEMKHRYFKVAKLAGVYAFLDSCIQIQEDHLYQAIALAEMSGEAFQRIFQRDRPYAKLAAYICSINREVTHADLVEDLPFYSGSETNRKELLNLAIAHGYRNNQVIKRETIDGIEILSGKALPETDLNNIILSYSVDITSGYLNKNAQWEKLHQLCVAPGYHWCVHQLTEHLDLPGKGGYRDEMHVVSGFNLAVVDVDGGASIDTAKLLLGDLQYLMYTTKRHADTAHRYRLVFPMSHVLELDSKDYKEFMANFFDWLPFEVDTVTNQRARKWLTNPGDYWYNDGELLDVYKFLPKTKKAEELKAQTSKLSNLNALEKWFVNHMQEGNRNNMLVRYAYALIDDGHDLSSVQNNVLALNNKIAEPLDEAEVLSTVIITANKKIHERNQLNES